MAVKALQSQPHGIRLLTLRLLDVPTGKSATHGVYTSDKIHNALMAQNPHYAKLTIISSPSLGLEETVNQLTR
jgi:hypothetical protein